MTFQGDILAKFVFGVDTWHTDVSSGELKGRKEVNMGGREGGRERTPSAQPAVVRLPQVLQGMNGRGKKGPSRLM